MQRIGVFSFRLFLALVGLGLLVGCAGIYPTHKNSHYDRDEKVILSMLDKNAVFKDYQADWCRSFDFLDNLPAECSQKPLIAETVVSAVVPAAIEYVANLFKKSSGQFEKQFQATTFRTDFWEDSTNLIPKYYGFELTRSAKQHKERKSADQKEDCFTVVYGLAKDRAGYFWVAPLYFKTTRTKAKLTGWSRKQKIISTVDISIDAVWVDGKGDFHQKNIASLDPFTVKKYDMESRPEIRRVCRDKNCSKIEGGIQAFSGVPISRGETHLQAGTFWIKGLVTEKDLSKAGKNLMALSTAISDSKDKVVEKIKESISAEEEK